MHRSVFDRLCPAKHTFAIALFALAFSIFASLLGATQFSYTETILWQGVLDFEVRSNVAYCLNPQGIRLLDITNPNSPSEISRLHLDGAPQSHHLIDNLMLVIDQRDRISTIEITQDNRLLLRGSLPTDVWPVSVVARGDYAYLLDGNPGDGFFLSVIDISNPMHPELVRRVEVGRWGLALQLQGNRVYAIGGTSDNNRICTFDISDPAIPQLIGTTDDLGDVGNFVVRNDTAFVCSDNPDLQVWDLRTASVPAKLGTLETSFGPVQIDILGDLVLLGDRHNSLRIVSVTNPRNPVSIGLHSKAGGMYGITHSGNTVFTSDGRILRSLDLTNPALPVAQMQFGPKDYPRDIEISDGKLFVAHGTDGLMVYDISGSTGASPVTTWSLPGCEVEGCGVLDVNVVAGRVYSKFGDDSLRVFELVGNDSLWLSATLGTPWNGSAASSLNGDTLIFNKGDGPVVAADFRNPAVPIELSVLRAGYGHVRAVGDRMIAIAANLTPYHPGIELYSLGDEVNANLVYSFSDLPQSCYWENPPGDGGGGFVCQYMSPRSVEIENSVLAVVNLAAGLMLFDISDPSNPTLTFRQYSSPYVTDVGVIEAEIRSDLAVLSRWNSMEVFDLADMSMPILAQTLHVGDYINDFILIEDDLYAATSSGITFFHLDQALDVDDEVDGLPVNFSLSQNNPNPFNATTKISLDLRKPSHVELSIFNIAGQRVRTLLDKDLQSGNHSVEWDGRDSFGHPVASGVYFYRMRAGDFQTSRKMVLLK